MHHSNALPSNSVRSRTRQPMTNGRSMLAHWSVRQKLNRTSSVQLRCSVGALT